MLRTRLISYFFKNGSGFSELRHLLVLSIVLSALSYITNIWLANALGPEAFGLYAYALLIGALLTQFINFGSAEIGIKNFYTFGERALSLIVNLKVINFISILIIAGGINFFNNDVSLMLGLMLSIGALNFATHYEAKKQNVRFMIIYALERAVITMILWFGLFIFGQEFNVFLIIAIIGFVQCLSILFQYHENRNYSKFTEFNGLVNTYKLGGYILIFELAKFAFGGLTRIVIYNKIGDQALGIFSSVWQFIPLATLYYAQATKAWRLRLTHALEVKSLGDFKKNCIYLTITILAPTSIGTAMLLFWGETIMELLFTDAYAGANALLPYLAIYILVVALDAVVVVLAIATGLNKRVAISYTVFGLLTVLITTFFISGNSLEVYVLAIILGHLGATLTLLLSVYRRLKLIFELGLV